jgi:hypothetical protein
LKEAEDLETQYDLLEEARLNYNFGPYSSLKLQTKTSNKLSIDQEIKLLKGETTPKP